MKTIFENQNFGKRLKSMLKVDFRRMFTTPLIYIMIGISIVLPILILVMTSLMPGSADPEAGATSTGSFTNVWQIIGTASGSAMSMDLTSMCNINILYFLVAVFVCVFVGDDFKSGYAKNLFTVRSKKTDYVISKSLAGFVGATLMLISFFIGAMLGGTIAGLSFTTDTASAGGIVACMFAKIFIVAVFVSIALLLSIVAKQKLWLSILCSFAATMLLFTMIPMVAPLNATIINAILSFAGAALFAAGLGAISNLILNKINIL